MQAVEGTVNGSGGTPVGPAKRGGWRVYSQNTNK
jgi:hypothetical protein